MKPATRITQVLKQYAPSSLKHLTNDFHFGDNNKFKIEIANDLETRSQAYKLLYKTYVEKEFAKPHASKMWYSIFDAHPDTITIVAKEGKFVRGAITIVIDSPLGLPAEGVFKKEINHLRQQKHSLAEIISLGIDNKTRGGSVILEKLFNFSYLYARGLFNTTKFIITINPRHSLFYTKKLLFKKKGELKEYKKVSGNPAAFLQLDLNLIYSIVESDLKYSEKYKRTIYSSFITINKSKCLIEKIMYSKAKMGMLELRHFFINQRNVFNLAKTSSMNILQLYFPEVNLFNLSIDQESGFIAI